MYSITNYDTLYRPCNKSGEELKKPDFVKLPINPKGDGLETLFEHKRGLEIFGVWCLLLEKTTAEKKPENRGKLLNHKGEPATAKEIAKGISLKSKTVLVEEALNTLVSIGWLVLRNKLPQERKEPPKPGAQVKVKVEVKVKDKEKHLDFVFLSKEEYQKLITRYGEPQIKIIIRELNNYIGSTGKPYKSHYYTLLAWARRKDIPILPTTEPDDPKAEAERLEKRKQKIRDEHGSYYREKDTDELKAMLCDTGHRLRHWLIKEILAEREGKCE